MIKTIWKFLLEIEDTQILKVPIGAEFLSILSQYQKEKQIEKLCLYLLVDPIEGNKETWNIAIRGTGHSVQENLQNSTFLDSVSTLNGALIWHIWKLNKN